MSLSKYYQNSSSFQPEELIKRNDKMVSGWQSQEQAKQLPFHRQPIPVAAATKKIAKETEERQPAAPAAPPPVAKDIDLSKYLEIKIAEKKIEEAYRQGVEAGRSEAEQDFGSTTRALLSTCQQLDNIRETLIRNSSEELLEFTLAIAEKIVRTSVREQDSTIVATIEEALQRAIKSDEFTVYIHPEDHAIIARKSPEIVAGLTGLNNIIVKKDTMVERGGAKIESDTCSIDATIASQFDLIREEIKKNL